MCIPIVLFPRIYEDNLKQTHPKRRKMKFFDRKVDVVDFFMHETRMKGVVLFTEKRENFAWVGWMCVIYGGFVYLLKKT
jgi:hypothetical protein